MSEHFWKKTNADGSLKRCKFCGGPVWWHVHERRWYDAGGAALHVESCATSARHHHEAALDTAEARRSRRPKS